jgi:hypothetical protein
MRVEYVACWVPRGANNGNSFLPFRNSSNLQPFTSVSIALSIHANSVNHVITLALLIYPTNEFYQHVITIFKL